MPAKSVLVVFGEDLPRKSKKWWSKINEVIGPKSVEGKVQNMNLPFVNIEKLVDPGNVQEACQLVDNLSRLTLADGSRLSKQINYCGYELWWVHYDDIYSKFCAPYTQYRRLLEYLKSFDKIYLYRVSYSGLFQYFLSAYGRKYIFLDKPPLISLGALVQVFLSLPFLLWLKITRPKLMVWTSDQFDPAHPPHDYDFRMRHIYKELRERKIPFVEFIRSQEKLLTVLRHARVRRRPVIYSSAIISFIYFLSRWLGEKRKIEKLPLIPKNNIQDQFWASIAICYLRNFGGTIWSIRTMKLILRWIGIKTAIIISGSGRSFHEILACKLNGIKTIGIQHGLTLRHLNIYEFMPSFDGELTITTDMYGLCSDWWKKYFILHSRAFRPEQLYVSGPMRPLEAVISGDSERHEISVDSLPRVLFVSEELAAPTEVLPYLSTLLEIEDLTTFLKFRSYRDVFEEWLKKNHPAILKKVKILKSGMHEAIAQSDVVIGSYSTGALEALLQLKPVIFFRTRKWGDCFDMKSFSGGSFFAENPEELLRRIRKSREIPKAALAELRERFFGDPHRNGSKWVVDQAQKLL